ncbi:MAG: hypothetical protein CMM90_03585 [Rickettsiales bacterium]|nr:hypothetical protein [Rickettsiales bacterium]|tara:strand:+ start:3736 stop:4221 length:486 start_codon:yes stop_codon:yes gene_type:complete
MFNFSFFFSILFLLFFFNNATAGPVGLSCYFDTGVKETNSTITDDEFENTTFGMMYDSEIEWFWRFPPEALAGQKIDEWKEEKDYLFRNTDKNVFASTNITIKNNKLNPESKQKNRPNEMYITQYYELDPKLNITYVIYQVFIYSYYEKKTKITRTGKCMR